MRFKNPLGSFEELFEEMEENIKTERLNKSLVRDALQMTENEKNISFLNNYFIYKKIRNVDAEKLVKILLSKKDEISLEGETEELIDVILNESKKIRREAIKYKKKIILPGKK